MWQVPVPFPAANAPEDAAADNEEWDNSVQMKVEFLEQRIINWMWVNFELEEQWMRNIIGSQKNLSTLIKPFQEVSSGKTLDDH